MKRRVKKQLQRAKRVLASVGRTPLYLALVAIVRKTVGQRRRLGLLSVVVPMHNVAEYLGELLQSIVSQSYPYLEIILVDDGSTDETVKIAERFARWDRRIIVIRAPHGGNGRARNIGVNAASGIFLTFADSDDLVAPDAYVTMMESLDSSGSEFAVGSYDRIINGKPKPVKLSDKLHSKRKLNIDVCLFPEIIDDVFLWNKVFLRDFWDRELAPIPENILYEDQETSAKAYVRAKAFDVLDQRVYSWRLRENASSITQGKRSQVDLVDRIEIAHRVSQIFLEFGEPSVCRVWVRRLLGSDLMSYYRQVPNTAPEYWEFLSAGARSLARLFSEPGVLDVPIDSMIGPHARILLAAAVMGDRNSVECIVVDWQEHGTGFEVVPVGDEFLARPGYWDDLPDELRSVPMSCEPQDLEFVTDLKMHEVVGSDEVRLRGHAYVRGLRSDQRNGFVTVSQQDGTELCLTRRIDDRLDWQSDDPFASHSAAGFDCLLPLSALEDGKGSSFQLSMKLSGHVFSRWHRLEGFPETSGRYLSGIPCVVGVGHEFDDNAFRIDVDWGVDKKAHPRLVLETRQSRIDPVRTEALDERTNRYVFTLQTHRWGVAVEAPMSGAYTVRWMPADKGTESTDARPISLSPDMEARLPLEAKYKTALVTLWQTAAGHLAVTFGPPLSPDERGRFHQRELARIFSRDDVPLLEPSAVFESFGGKFCTDSPRAISDRLTLDASNLRIYWSVADLSVPVPSYAVPLVRGTRTWFEVMHRASVLVNNNNFPHYFRKNPRQFYLQTWHGTPLKRIGSDVPTGTLSPSYRGLMAREAHAWDVLLAQNSFAAEVLPKALGFTGRVLTCGYPRNDGLTGPDVESRCLEIRENLGMRKGDRVILYAPTWRDDVKDSAGNIDRTMYLDLEVMKRKLGPDIIVLFRGHHTTSRAAAVRSTGILDVSDYPQVNDLILASDLLVTDYSSIMYDYAVTRKPIYIYAPDLDQYERKTRGFYLEFQEGLPGPPVRTTEALCRNILSPADVKAAEKFATRFASNDDGSATERVVTALRDVLLWDATQKDLPRFGK
ncbi:CDP-glycerol glycerophosphotransferase family protein [Arthrobacter sp. NPDC090010]|uniref:bifunctional glycosyltransferase/CDP-glycerol:glycerophosphate glycerophosphotransferase n=1 Tax=Arthrobacter sp. NPDC090010 TaxID=3363942 RepID=UPI00380C47ED